MVTYHETWTAAQFALDENLSEGKVWQKSSRPRRLVKVGLSGSTAPFDAGCEVLIGSEKVMHLENTQLTTIALQTTGQIWHPSKLTISAGVPVNIIVTDAALTNAVYMFLDFQELVP